MTIRNNTWFKEKEAALREFSILQRRLKDEENEALCSGDEDEACRISAQIENLEYPVTTGVRIAVRDWERSTDTFICRDFLWDKDIPDYIEALRAAGITEFLYADESTAVMRCAHGFVGEGAKLEGTATFTEDDGLFKTTYLCLRFSL